MKIISEQAALARKEEPVWQSIICQSRSTAAVKVSRQQLVQHTGPVNGSTMKNCRNFVISGKRKEAVYKEILLCRNAPAEYQDRETLWNSVMKVEKSKDAQFAREFEIALPREADRESQIKMLHDFFEPLVEEGMCIDFAIHDKGDGNPHCHSLATMRPIREDGSWGDKEKKGYLLDLNGNRIPVIDPAGPG